MSLIIFDLDHTLVDHRDDTYYHIFNKALNHFGINQVSPDEYKNLKKVWNAESLEKAHSIIENTFKIKGKDFFEVIDLNDPRVHETLIQKGLVTVFDDVASPLRKIKQNGHKTAIVTNSSKMSAKVKTSMIGQNFFDLVITKDDVEELKPSPEPLLKTINVMGFEKKDVLFIGDSEVDKIAAEKAGINFLLIDRENGNGDIDTLEAVNKMIHKKN